MNKNNNAFLNLLLLFFLPSTSHPLLDSSSEVTLIIYDIKGISIIYYLYSVLHIMIILNKKLLGIK